MNYNTGVGSRHVVTFPEPDYCLDRYSVGFSWDDTRNSFMAIVSLWNIEKGGGYSAEDIVIYFLPDDTKETAYKALAEALKLSGHPWKIRKLWYSPSNRTLRNKLKQHGWYDQGEGK